MIFFDEVKNSSARIVHGSWMLSMIWLQIIA